MLQRVVRTGCPVRDGKAGAKSDRWAGWATFSPRSHAYAEHSSKAHRAALVMLTGVGQQLCDHQTNL